MSKRTVLLLLTVVSVVALGVVSVTSSKEQLSAQQLAELTDKEKSGRITLEERAQLAKARGKRRIVLPGAAFSTFVEVKDLDQALSRYTVVVAEPIEHKGYWDHHGCKDFWVKFKLLDTVSKASAPECPTCPMFPEPPSELLPLGDDEILVPKSGGTLIVDGVEMVAIEADLPEYKKGQKYLLFLETDATGRVGVLSTGPVGVMKIKSDGDSVEAIGGEKFILQEEIEKRAGDSVSGLRTYAVNRRVGDAPPQQ